MAFNLARGVLTPEKLVRIVKAMNAERWQSQLCSNPAIANGTTAGYLKTVNSITYKIAGRTYTKGATDDLWNLTAPTDTAAGEYQAVILFLDASGTASITACTIKSTAALALAEVEANLDNAKAAIGVFVAGPSTDYDAALSSQGTIYNGVPDGAFAYTLPITLTAP